MKQTRDIQRLPACRLLFVPGRPEEESDLSQLGYDAGLVRVSAAGQYGVGSEVMNLIETDILLVEDNPNDAELAVHALSGQNLANNIVIARNGEEALDFLFCRGPFAERTFDQPPKMVLLDLKLPKVDGIEVVKQLKDDPRTRAIPVVILTSSKEERDLARSYDLGANSYIEKPVDFEQFRQTFKTVGLYWMVINQRPVPSRPQKSAGQGSP